MVYACFKLHSAARPGLAVAVSLFCRGPGTPAGVISVALLPVFVHLGFVSFSWALVHWGTPLLVHLGTLPCGFVFGMSGCPGDAGNCLLFFARIDAEYRSVSIPSGYRVLSSFTLPVSLMLQAHANRRGGGNHQSLIFC